MLGKKRGGPHRPGAGGPRDHRKHAQDFADAGLAAFSEPKRHTSLPQSDSLKAEILDKAEEVRLPGNGGGFAFAGYLGAKLANQKTPWNSVALVTALYNLNELDPIWPTRSASPDLCELIVHRLHTIANKETLRPRNRSSRKDSTRLNRRRRASGAQKPST